MVEARSGEWATCLMSWCRALFAGPIGGFPKIELLAFGWVLSVLVTTTFDGIMVKLVGPLEAPHILLFSWASGRVVSRSWGRPLPLPVTVFWYLCPLSGGVRPLEELLVGRDAGCRLPLKHIYLVAPKMACFR